MGQTKRKRRTKHRGNAVGKVEARGRTSKPQPGAKAADRGGRGGGRGAGGSRELRPPSMRSAAMKALFGGVLLFLFARFGLLGEGSSTVSALLLAAIAVVFYTPIMFLTDKWVYGRKLKMQGQAPQGRKR